MKRKGIVTMGNKRARLVQARMSAGLTQDQMAYRLGVDVSTVKRWETGNTTPSAWAWPKIGQLLDLSRAELADILTAKPSSLAPRVPSSTAPAPITDEIDWERLTTIGSRPSLLTDSAVTDLEHITDRQRRLYHELSSAEMLTQVQTHFALLGTLLTSPQPEPIRRRIAGAAAEAAGFAAWLWFDLGDTAQVQQCYEQARTTLREAGDPALGAYITAYRALVATYGGRRQEALSLLDGAVGGAPHDLSGQVRSWLEIHRAHALAVLGRQAEATIAIQDAHDLHTHSAPTRVEPWMYDFDEGSLAAHTGHCHLALDQAQLAGQAFDRALRLQPRSCDRRGAKVKLGLARARLAIGDSDEALHLTTQALDVFARRGSVHGLREVARVRSDFLHRGLRSAVRAIDAHQRAIQQEL